MGMMKLNNIFTLVAAMFLAGCAQPPDEEIFFINGKIYTLNEEQPLAEAVAVREGRIAAVGDTETISAMADANTRLVDLDGQVMLPGFHDLHVHPVYAGMQAQRCVIPQGSHTGADSTTCQSLRRTGSAWRVDHRRTMGRVDNRQGAGCSNA